MDEVTVDAAELGALLKRAPKIITLMARRGEIPGFKVGRQWRFFPSKVIAHLEKPRDLWAQPARSSRRKAA